MRIAFDATTLQRRQTGIGYYTEHLLHHLLEVEPDHDYLLLSNRAIRTSQPLVRKLDRRGMDFPLRTVWMQGCAPWVLLRSRPQVAHFTNSMMPLACPSPAVLTVHDMSLHLHPELHPYRRRLTRPLVTASIKKAQAVITVSRSARRDILQLLDVPAHRVHVVYEAPAPQFRPIEKGDRLEQKGDRLERKGDRLEQKGDRLELTRREFGLPDRFLLFVGAIEPRKNLVRLIDAFARLEASGSPHRLVLAGPPLWGYREVALHIRKLGLQRAIHMPGYLPYERLPALYNLADAFVFPSLYEGFGLPVVEAMACGLPVLTSRGTAMAEVAGDAAVLVDPRDVDSIEEGIRVVLNAEEAAKRSRLSLARAAEFSWVRAAKETLRVYETVAEGT